MDYTVYGILQARILELVAVPFSRVSFQPRDWTQVSHIADSLSAEPPRKPIWGLGLQQMNCSGGKVTQIFNSYVLWFMVTCYLLLVILKVVFMVGTYNLPFKETYLTTKVKWFKENSNK